MSYATSDDLTARYPNRDLVQLTNEDPAATTINAAFAQQALSDASAEIDSYLESRFTLPLTDPPATLARLCCDIAMYRIQALRPLHDLSDARQRYDDAIALLLRVAQGEADLGLAADSAEALTAPAVETVENSGRVFSRDSLKGF